MRRLSAILCAVALSVPFVHAVDETPVRWELVYRIPYGFGEQEIPPPEYTDWSLGGPGQIARSPDGQILLFDWQTSRIIELRRDGSVRSRGTVAETVPAFYFQSQGDIALAWGTAGSWPVVFDLSGDDASAVMNLAGLGLSASSYDILSARLVDNGAYVSIRFSQKGDDDVLLIRVTSRDDEPALVLRGQELTDWVTGLPPETDGFWVDDRSGVLMFGPVAASGYFGDQYRYYSERWQPQESRELLERRRRGTMRLLGTGINGESYWTNNAVVFRISREGEVLTYYDHPIIRSRRSIGHVDDDGYLWWLVHGEDSYDLMRTVRPLHDPAETSAIQHARVATPATTGLPTTLADRPIGLRMVGAVGAPAVDFVSPMTAVRVLEQSETQRIGPLSAPWHRIATADGTEGWIYGAFLDFEE